MVGIITSERYLAHGVEGHPERPARLKAIVRALRESNLPLEWLDPRSATREEIEAVHARDHIEKVEALSRAGGWFDTDTYAVPGSHEIAVLAAGGVLTAVERALGTGASCFCAVRPPGHHATRNRAMGFCLYNNVAIAARFARSKGTERVLIADFDVHHGNGTQEIFYEDPAVLYLSAHRHPFYPGTGLESERGSGPGEGFTLNVPLPAGTRPAEYRSRWLEAVEKAFELGKPGLVIVSAGFDGYAGDPIAGLNLQPEDYFEITRVLVRPGVPVVSALEGGYDLEGIGACVVEHVRALAESGDRG